MTKIGVTRITDPGDSTSVTSTCCLAFGTRTILAVEAKDFEVARTPREMAHEITKLFREGAAESQNVDRGQAFAQNRLAPHPHLDCACTLGRRR